MSAVLEVPLEDLEEWLERELAPILEPLKAEGTNLFNDVRSKLDDLRDACGKLSADSEAEMTKANRKTYRSSRTANKFGRGALDAVEKVVVPDEFSRENLRMLNEDLERTLVTIEQERMKLFRRIEPFFIFDRRRFDIALKRALDSFKALRSFSSQKYVKADTMEDAFSVIHKLFVLLRDLEKAQKRKRQTEIRKKGLENRVKKKQLDIEAVQKKTEMQGLAQTNEEIEELEKKVKNSLRHLQKPFFKFQALSRGPGQYLMLEEAQKLEEYLKKPFEAFASEEDGYPLLKSILRKMVNAIDQGKLKLKSSRLRKAQGQVKSIVDKDTLIPLHRKCKEAFSRKQQILTSEAMESSQQDLAQHQKMLMELQKHRKFVESKHGVLDGEYQELLQKIESQKKELEKTVLRLTGKRVTVTYDLPVN